MNASGSVARVVEGSREDAANPSSAEPIVFPEGIYGFPACRTFQIAPTPREGLYWLQSTEHPALCLLLADPFVHFAGYAVDLPDLDVAHLDVRDPTDVVILVTVTLSDETGRASSANLQGPIVVNTGNRHGRQVILNDRAWGVREPIDLRRYG